jgi:hypothetical protein
MFNKVNSSFQFELIMDEEKLNIDRIVGQEKRTYFCYRVGSVAGVFRMRAPEFNDIGDDTVNLGLVEKMHANRQSNEPNLDDEDDDEEAAVETANKFKLPGLKAAEDDTEGTETAEEEDDEDEEEAEEKPKSKFSGMNALEKARARARAREKAEKEEAIQKAELKKELAKKRAGDIEEDDDDDDESEAAEAEQSEEDGDEPSSKSKKSKRALKK